MDIEIIQRRDGKYIIVRGRTLIERSMGGGTRSRPPATVTYKGAWGETRWLPQEVNALTFDSREEAQAYLDENYDRMVESV